MKRWRRWLRLGRPTLGGLVRACAVLTVVAMVMASQAVAYYETPGINGIASKLAGRKVTIHCLTKREAKLDLMISLGASAYVNGWTDPVTGRWRPDNYAVFDYGICQKLTRLASGKPLDGHNAYDLVWAIIVITHESGHLKGAPFSHSESFTQCWTFQHLRATMRMLGRPKAEHDLLYGLAWDLQQAMPPPYQFTDCKGVN